MESKQVSRLRHPDWIKPPLKETHEDRVPFPERPPLPTGLMVHRGQCLGPVRLPWRTFLEETVTIVVQCPPDTTLVADCTCQTPVDVAYHMHARHEVLSPPLWILSVSCTHSMKFCFL